MLGSVVQSTISAIPGLNFNLLQSCQVQMIKNLDVVGAFSSEQINIGDLHPPPVAKKFSDSVPF